MVLPIQRRINEVREKHLGSFTSLQETCLPSPNKINVERKSYTEEFPGGIC